MKVSVTERATFKRCRRQWGYSSFNVESLGPIAPRTALSLGTTVHAALAQWLLAPDASLPELFARAGAKDQADIQKAYRQRVGAEISDAELQPFHDGFELGLAMMKNYEQKWRTPLFDGFTIVQPETQIEVQIPHSEHILSARLDAIIRQTSTGNLYVVDHKTYSNRPRLDTLQMTDQFLIYTWAVSQLGIGPVKGLAFDGMWKRAVPPRNSTFDDLFTRLLISYPQYEIDNVAAQLLQEVTDMEYAMRDNALYPNRRWEGCYDCNFNALCMAQSRGEDTDHIKKYQYVRVDADHKTIEGEE